MIRISCLAAFLICIANVTHAQSPSSEERLKKSVDEYTSRYGLTTLYGSASDDHGRGKPELRGLRNFRAVMPGILYRAGANNVYRTEYGKPKLANNGPLPEEGMANLCQQGFSEGYYVYGATGSESTKKCDGSAASNVMKYSGLHPQYSESDRRKFLAAIRERIVSNDHRPILVHCWNGYHASGVASAIALRQFCGFSAEDAVTYWNATAAPLEKKAKEQALAHVRDFKPIESLSISASEQESVCFHGPIAGQHAVWRLSR